MTDNGSRVYPCENLIPYANTVDNVIRQQCDYIEVADNIIYIAKGTENQLEDVNFTENMNKRLENSYNYTKSLSWKEVCKSWTKYFKETY